MSTNGATGTQASSTPAKSFASANKTPVKLVQSASRKANNEQQTPQAVTASSFYRSGENKQAASTATSGKLKT